MNTFFLVFWSYLLINFGLHNGSLKGTHGTQKLNVFKNRVFFQKQEKNMV